MNAIQRALQGRLLPTAQHGFHLAQAFNIVGHFIKIALGPGDLIIALNRHARIPLTTAKAPQGLCQHLQTQHNIAPHRALQQQPGH